MTSGQTTLLEEQDLPFLDVLGEAFAADAARAIDAVRPGTRFARSRRGVEVLTYADCAELVTDTRFDSQNASVYERMGGPSSLVEFANEGLLVAMNGDKHRRIRKVFSAGFRVKHINHQRDVMRGIAESLFASWGEDDVEFVSKFSSPFPMQILCTLLGVPTEDIPVFTKAASDLHVLAAVPMAPGFPQIDSALRTLSEYVNDLVARRRARPEDDIISDLIAVQETEGHLSDRELSWNLVNLIFAGQDTTRYQLASAVRAVIDGGAWEQLAAAPDLIPAAVEECLRLQPVTRFVVRIPQTDVMIGNLRVGAGRRVIVNFLAASRDPTRFAEPHAFVVPRPEAPFGIPFGWGLHHCLGATLARAEIQVALATLVTTFTDVSVDSNLALTPPAGMLHGPENMRLRFRQR